MNKIKEAEKPLSSTSDQADLPIRGYSSVSEEERAARLFYIETLRQRGASEHQRWKLPASHQVAWADRAMTLAAMVRPGEAVFEFGAGASIVRNSLPSGCRYTGSDLSPIITDLIKYDLNAGELSPLPGHDVALFSGVLEYVHDMNRLFSYLGKYFKSVVCSYALVEERSQEAFDRRRYSGWFTDFDYESFLALSKQGHYTLTARDKWGDQFLFRFDKAQR